MTADADPLCGEPHPTLDGIRCTRLRGSCATSSEAYPLGFHEVLHPQAAIGDVVWPLDIVSDRCAQPISWKWQDGQRIDVDETCGRLRDHVDECFA